MDAVGVLKHVQSLYGKGDHADCAVVVGGRRFVAHRLILSMSRYFAALMSSEWQGEGPRGVGRDKPTDLPTPLQFFEFEVDGAAGDGGVTAESFESMLRFLYGFPPDLTLDNVESLLATASFFDVPAMCNSVSDYVFNHLTQSTVVKFVNMVVHCEYGEPGKMIEDASFAYLFRNAMEVANLHQLPVASQKRLLTASELYVKSEWDRYQLAVRMLRATRAALHLAQGLMAGSGHSGSGLAQATPLPPSPVSVDGGRIGCTPPPPHAPPPSPASDADMDEEMDGGLAHEGVGGGWDVDGWQQTGGVVHRLLSTSESSAATLDSPLGVHAMHGRRTLTAGAATTTATASGFGSRCTIRPSSAASTTVADVCRGVDGGGSRLTVLDEEMGACPSHAAPPITTGVGRRAFASPPPGAGAGAGALDVRDMVLERSPVPGGQDACAGLTELEEAYADVFASIRFVHMTPAELDAVQADGEVPAGIIHAARQLQRAMEQKLQVASLCNVKRLSDLMDMPVDTITASSHISTSEWDSLRSVSWPPYRFGVEVEGVYDVPPLLPAGDSMTFSSERVLHAGSVWSLDVKRHERDGDRAEVAAVYLRRRSPRTQTGAYRLGPLPTFEDLRDRVTASFSIRLCGAPGAPTTNSVCGRSVMGKAFGVDSETSWGWENYLSTASLTDKPWADGDRLRFVITLDLL